MQTDRTVFCGGELCMYSSEDSICLLRFQKLRMVYAVERRLDSGIVCMFLGVSWLLKFYSPPAL